MEMFTTNPLPASSFEVVPYCSFWVDGKPKATPRIKAFRRGKFTKIMTPDTADDWKAMVAITATPYLPQTPITAPIFCAITLIFPRPKRLCRKKDPSGLIPMPSKPDRDNCEKAILDILTNIGMWRDDSQVFAGAVEKYYHAKYGKPGAYIKIGTVAADAKIILQEK